MTRLQPGPNISTASWKRLVGALWKAVASGEYPVTHGRMSGKLFEGFQKYLYQQQTEM